MGLEVTNSPRSLKKIYETGEGRITIRYDKGGMRYVKVKMCALDDNYKYKKFNLQKYLRTFINESRKSIKEFANAMLVHLEEREKLANNYAVINEHIEEIVTIMRKAKGEEELKRNLAEQLRLTEEQIELAVNFELPKIVKLYLVSPIQQRIAREKQRYEQLANSSSEIDKFLRQQLQEIKDEFADERRMRIVCREKDSNNGE